jgi:type II secretory pathway pseudopilin PulG
MNRRQRALLIESLIVVGVALVAITALINLKDWTNRREALRAMANISQQVQTYEREHGSIPTPDYIDSLKESAPGRARLGKLKYPVLSTEQNSPDSAILAYTQQRYRSFLIHSGYVVLFRNGQVSWMLPEQFQSVFTEQDNAEDIKTD